MSPPKDDQLERHYLGVIEKLKKDQRPLIVIDQELQDELKKRWSEGLEKKDLISIQKVLCLLDNTQTYSDQFQDLFTRTLNEIEDKDTLIYLLGAAAKHMIISSQRKGERVSYDWTIALERKLNAEDFELLEWVLRTIDQYGAQSIRFKEAILKRKPGWLTVMNPHKKNCREIIIMLERRWSELVKRL